MERHHFIIWQHYLNGCIAESGSGTPPYQLPAATDSFRTDELSEKGHAGRGRIPSETLNVMHNMYWKQTNKDILFRYVLIGGTICTLGNGFIVVVTLCELSLATQPSGVHCI